MSGGTFSISSRGWDVSGASDQFTFISRAVSGDVSLVARVASLQNTDAWSLAGLMIRQSLAAGSRQASLFVTPAKGVVVRGRASAGGGTVQMTVGSGAAPVWLRLDRRASTVKSYRSTDGVTWTLLASLKIPLNSNVVVGLAVASHSASASVAASVTNVSVNGTPISAPVPVPTPSANTPPLVSLNSPATGSVFAAPATMAMSATASDGDGSVAKVDFYAGSARLGSDSTSPYAFSWSGVPAGSYALKAVATDNAGATATSATVTVTVAATNAAPAVSMTSPSSGATFLAPASVAFAATASDSDGTIQRVDFYAGSTLIASDTTSPYSFTWLNVAAGVYSVAAVARDNLGATTLSPSRNITVAAPTVLSKAVFTPAVVPEPINYYVLEVFAAGSNPSTAAPIATQNLGLPPIVDGECTADIRNLMLSLAPGNYVATVSSVSANEGVLRSAPFTFTR